MKNIMIAEKKEIFRRTFRGQLEWNKNKIEIEFHKY